MRATAHLTTSTSFSLPRLLLHLEGLAALVVSIALYAYLGANGWVFALLLLIPDVSMIGYLVDARLGSLTYNAAHTYTLPLALGAFSLLGGWQPGVQIALIWSAHIGMDRALGYGLKYPTAFQDTHFNRL